MIGRKAPLVLVVGVVLGIVLPGFGAVVGQSLPILVVMLLAAAMLRVDFSQVLSHLRRPVQLGVLLLALMVAIPLAAHGLATVLGLSPVLHTGLVLMACAPPLASSPGMAAFLKLDDALALNAMVAGTLLLPLSAPILTSWMIGFPADLNAVSLLSRLAFTVGIALAVAFIIRRSVGRRRIEENADILDGISALIMVMFAIVLMNGVGIAQMQEPARLGKMLGTVLLANWGLHLLTGSALLIFVHFCSANRTRLTRMGGAIALLTGNRNIALFLAVLPPETAAPLFLFIALYQIPIYLTPVVAAPIYKRLLAT